MNPLKLAIVAAMAAAVVLCTPPDAVGGATIVTTGANISVGTGTSNGTLTIDPCAPAGTAPSLSGFPAAPVQGTITGSLPAFPGAGTSIVDQSFALDATLPGGTYDVRNYTVSSGARVTYTGAVTIRASGNVSIDGVIDTTASGASITVLCAGNVTVQNGGSGTPNGVETSGSGSPVTIEANDTLRIGADGSLLPDTLAMARANSGDVVLRAHGTDLLGRRFEAFNADIGSAAGGVQMQSARGVRLERCTVRSEVDDIDVQAYGASAVLVDSSLEARVGLVTFEAGGTTQLSDASSILATGGNVRLESFNSSIFIGDSSVVEANDGAAFGVASAGNGTLDLRARLAVNVQSGSTVQSRGAGDLSLIAYQGNVAVESSGSTARVLKQGSGFVLIDAARFALLSEFTDVDSQSSAIDIFARSGDVIMLGESTVSATFGSIDLRAANALNSEVQSETEVILPCIVGSSVRIEAGDGGISDFVVDRIHATDAAVSILSSGPIDLTGNIEGRSAVSIVAQDDSITCTNSVIRTTDLLESGSSDTGSILIESYGDDATVIDLSNSTITSGDSDFLASGDVSILIHTGGEIISSFILPKTVKLKVNAKKRDKSFIRVAGVFDSGPDEFVAAGPASVWIGDDRIDGTVEPKGRRFQLRNGDFRFLITPAGAGGSRGKFNLQHKGLSIADGIDPDGDLTIRFQNDTADGIGTVTLEKGKYKLGKKAGTLTVPNLVPFKIKATHKGAGKDTLFVQAGLSTGGSQPEEAPDVTITYQGLEISVPGAEFKRNGDNFIANKPPSAPNVKKMQLNFKKEKVELNVGGLDLGPIPTQATKVTLGVMVGDDSGTVEVRVAPRKNQMRY